MRHETRPDPDLVCACERPEPQPIPMFGGWECFRCGRPCGEPALRRADPEPEPIPEGFDW